VWYGGFSSALKSRVTLGKGGLHYLFFDMRYQRPVAFEGKGAGEAQNRIRTSLAYEGVFLAVDDQPISLRLAASGRAEPDAPEGARDLEVRLLAGLRVSFWAPPPELEPLPDVEEP
jgi:hypothetical protein